MTFKSFQSRLLLRVLVMFGTLFATALIMVGSRHFYGLLLLTVPLVVFELSEFIRIQKKVHQELSRFVESIKRRDFSRHFDADGVSTELKPLRKAFNEINGVFKTVSQERERQYQYLEKTLELVDTGILSYNMGSGETGWMNEAFKNLAGIPYLKTIRALEKRQPGLYQDIVDIKPGENRIVTIRRNHQMVRFLISASVLSSEGKMNKIVAFQDINEALDETESEAWQKLLSVMTHEIMNSVAPISSLAGTLMQRLQKRTPASDSPADFEDLEIGIETIKRRSDGLLKFTESYRNFNQIGPLAKTKVSVRDIFEQLSSLMLPSLENKGIELEIILRDPSLVIEADVELIEQTLINLVINAMEAVKEKPSGKISLSGELLPNNKPLIRVADNGAGIPAELLDQIFVPFFTTRKTGAGIGLSLCKKIMLLHKGNIQVKSAEGTGSVFLLEFPA